MTKRFFAFCLLATVVALFALASACDNDDSGPSEEEIAEFEEIARQLAASGPEDIDFFLAHVTSRALEFFGYSSAEECRANAEDCIGEPSEPESVTGTNISGDEASTTVITEEDVLDLGFVREQDTWKLNSFAFSATIPDGTEVIDVSSVDYGYEWDSGALPDGEFAFAMKNDGSELHEMAVARKTADYDIDTLIDAAGNLEEEEAELPGIEEPVGFAFATPGATSNVVFESPLEAGDYVLVCFIPNAEGTPHIALGMSSEFTVE